MEPHFTNKTTFTKQNIIESYQATFSPKLRTIFFLCIGLLIFLGGLLTRNYALCLLGIFVGIFYPLFLLWTVRYSAAKRYQQLQQLYHSELETANRIYEDHLDVHHLQDGAAHTITYTQVAKVYETKNVFFLMLSTGIGFMLEKHGFEGTTAVEFGQFIRARAVGEGQIALKKSKRKTTLIITAILLVSLAIGVAFGIFGDAIENMIPRTFSDGNYSIRLTSAFKEYDDEWASSDVTVFYIRDTAEDLIDSGSVFETAAAYLQDANQAYDINGVITPVSDSRAWTTYTDNYEGNEYFNYGYAIMSDGDFWYTEFYCLAKDTDQYRPLFEKWAQTITIR